MTILLKSMFVRFYWINIDMWNWKKTGNQISVGLIMEYADMQWDLTYCRHSNVDSSVELEA